jgi:hypothetical protein
LAEAIAAPQVCYRHCYASFPFLGATNGGTFTGACEDSSAGRQRLGHISKQGNSLLRFLLVEASQATARCNPDWRRRYAHLMMLREKELPKWPWPGNSLFGCTGCGETIGNIRSWLNVRTRESSESSMA